nr:hypothetical protein [Tanacetum cinerariifolium]
MQVQEYTLRERILELELEVNERVLLGWILRNSFIVLRMYFVFWFNEDLQLGNLKFVPKGERDEVFGMKIPNELITDDIMRAPYYKGYLEMVAKHERKIAAEKEGGKKKTATKADKSVKHAPAKQAKPATAKQPNPKPHVDEPDEEQAQPKPEPKPQEATRPLSVVEDKGKEIATEEQAAQSLLALHAPKRRNAEIGADTDTVISEGDIEILNIGEEQGEDVDNKAGPDPVQSYVALVGPNPEPIHDDFVAKVYPKVYEILKFPADKQVVLEDPLSSSRTLSSMKNLDDTYTFGDEFFNDKSTKDELGKQNVDAKVVSMVTILIHQASTSVPPLSTPIIDLSPLKPVAYPLLKPFIAATTETTTTTLQLPPPPQQQSITDSELVARVTALKKKFSDLEQKSQTLDDTTQNLRSRVFTLELRDLPHKINQTVMKLSMRDDFLAEKDKSQKRRRNDQDPPPPPPDSDLTIKKRHDSDASGSKQPPAPQYGIVHQMILQKDMKEKLSKSDLEGPAFKLLTDQVDLVNPEGHRLVPDVSKPLPVGGPPARMIDLSISKLKADNYPDFGLEELVPSLWIESEHDYNISAAYGITHWRIKTFERYDYAYLREIVICRADYNEYKILEADFKNLHPNDFEDLYLLHLQGKLNHLSGSDKVHIYNAINMWIRNIVITQREEDLQLEVIRKILILLNQDGMLWTFYSKKITPLLASRGL